MRVCVNNQLRFLISFSALIHARINFAPPNIASATPMAMHRYIIVSLSITVLPCKTLFAVIIKSGGQIDRPIIIRKYKIFYLNRPLRDTEPYQPF